MNKFMLLAICGLLLLAKASAEPLSREKIIQLFKQGNELFNKASDRYSRAKLLEQKAQKIPSKTDEFHKKAQEIEKKAREMYRQAAMCYEGIIKGEVKNGKLYYNLGNAYYYQGDIGRAILNYKRAALYIPTDANLLQNIEYARSKRKEQIGKKEKIKALSALFFWHYELSGKTRLAIFAILSALAWMLAIVRLFFHDFSSRWAILSFATLASCLFISLAVDYRAEKNNASGVIIDKELVAYKTAGAIWKSFKKPLHAGVEFTSLETRGDWRHIELSDGRQCWIEKKASEMVIACLKTTSDSKGKLILSD